MIPTTHTTTKPTKFRVRDYNCDRLCDRARAEGITPTELLNRILDREFGTTNQSHTEPRTCPRT